MPSDSEITPELIEALKAKHPDVADQVDALAASVRNARNPAAVLTNKVKGARPTPEVVAPVQVKYDAHGLPLISPSPGALTRDGSWWDEGVARGSSAGLITYLRQKREHRWFSPKNAAEIIRNSPHAEMFGETTLQDWERPEWNNGGWDWPYVHCGTSAGEVVKRATSWAWTEVAPLRPGLEGTRLSNTVDYVEGLLAEMYGKTPEPPYSPVMPVETTDPGF